MVDFNREIPKGSPKLPADYWTKQKERVDNQKQNPLFDENIKTTFEDLSDVSIFKGRK